MSDERSSVLSDALEDIAHLVRSENRVRILETLSKRPRTRRELSEATGISRATVGRITMDLESRGWAVRTPGSEYETTSAGEHIVSELLPFAESVAAVRRLGDAIEWLPTEEISIDLRHFSDAVVKRPEHDDPMEMIDYLTDAIADASDVRVLTHFAPPEPFARSVHAGVLSGRLTGTFVMTDEIFEYLRDRPNRRQRWQELIDAGAEAYRYDGDVPCNLLAIDETVFIKSSKPESVQLSYGVPILSRNDAVRSWAHELIDGYRDDAVRLRAGTFDDDQDAETVNGLDSRRPGD